MDVDFFNLFATKRAGQPDGWQWFRLETTNNGAILLEGLVPTSFYQRGPRKGEPQFSKSDKSTLTRIVMTSADEKAIRREWEAETGLCSKCRGAGKEQIQWPSRGDKSFRPCGVCGGSGKASMP